MEREGTAGAAARGEHLLGMCEAPNTAAGAGRKGKTAVTTRVLSVPV